MVDLQLLKKQALVLDIETSAHYDNGTEVNINSDDYVLLAQCKWFGAYSYKHNKEYYLEVSKNRDFIRNLIQEHTIIVGFNNEEFDYEIIKNNSLADPQHYTVQTDCMKILGAATFKDKNGFKYKGRGELMGFKFKKNSLECMAETMKLEFQKSEIDYTIFHQNSWNEEETKEIIFYLRNDVMATKGLFDKLWDYWLPFTGMIDDKNIENLSWIRSSIASLIYKSVCYELGTEATYAEHKKEAEEMGGNVFLPKYEEVENAWIIDVASLYPHTFYMFNLFSETTPDNVIAWHGNDLFKVKGYYDVSYQPKLSLLVQKKLKERFELAAIDKKNPMVYTLKIYLNGLYGIVRSALFEKVHTPNAGWDVCWLGQQIQDIFKTMLYDFGFETIAGDTDSVMLRALKEEYNNEKYLRRCLDKILVKIFSNVPFPIDTFNVKIEKHPIYMLFPFSEEPLVDEKTRKLLADEDVKGYLKTEKDGKKVIIDEATGDIVKVGRSWVKMRRGLKKNYMYLYEEKGELQIEIVGLGIIKDGATPLGMKIFDEVLTPLILKNKKAKFTKEFIDNTIQEYLKKAEILKLLAREFKVKTYSTYKISKGKTEPTGIHAQISKGYFNGKDGVIALIKNTKVGNAGMGDKYCTLEEAIAAKLTIEDLGLEKVYKELEPFMIYEVPKPKERKPRKKKAESLTTP